MSQKSSKKPKTKPVSDEDASPEDEGDYSSVEDYETDSEDEPPRQSFGLLAGKNLPAKQKEKIKLGKFVGMSYLLPENYTKKGDAGGVVKIRHEHEAAGGAKQTQMFQLQAQKKVS